MPTPEKSKIDNFASVEEAIARSGLRTLSHLESRAHKLTVDEVNRYEKELESERERGVYAGPYTPEPGAGLLDERNYWTSRQDKAETIEPEPIPDVPPVSIDPTSKSFLAAGGGGSILVTMTGPGLSRSWTVDMDADKAWLHLDAPPLHEPQTLDGVVEYTVDENLGTVARTAHFYINGKTFTIDQAASLTTRR
jgi:hypothetical protein